MSSLFEVLDNISASDSIPLIAINHGPSSIGIGPEALQLANYISWLYTWCAMYTMKKLLLLALLIVAIYCILFEACAPIADIIQVCFLGGEYRSIRTIVVCPIASEVTLKALYKMDPYKNHKQLQQRVIVSLQYKCLCKMCYTIHGYVHLIYKVYKTMTYISEEFFGSCVPGENAKDMRRRNLVMFSIIQLVSIIALSNTTWNCLQRDYG